LHHCLATFQGRQQTAENRWIKALLVAFPTRTQITGGPAAVLSARMVTKSSSLVTKTAPIATA